MSYLSLNYPYSSSVEKELYLEWEGPLTEEKIQQAKSEYAQLQLKEDERTNDEEVIYSDSDMLKMWMYQKIIMSQSIEKNVTDRLNELSNENNVKSNMEENMLEKITINQFSHHTGPAQMIGFVEFGSFMVLGVMLLFGLSPIYSKEYSSGVDNYIFSSKKGRNPLAWAKIGAALIFTFAVVLGWEMFNFLVNSLLHGNQGWSTPLQLYTLYMNPAYADSSYAFSMFEYHFIQLGIHLLAGFAFALLIVAISSVSKNSLTTLLIGGFIYGAPLVLGGLKWLEPILAFSYSSVARVQFLFTDFKTVDIFGYPILYPVFACLVMIVLSLLSIKIVLKVIKNKEITS